MLDGQGTLLFGLATVYHYAAQNPQQPVVIYGHTDTSGESSYNQELSQWRAEAIKALLDNDTNGWLDAVSMASGATDYKQIFSTLASLENGECNAADSTEATRAFQSE
jgi:hypothetical protein